MTPLFLGAYWGSRKKTIADCARRTRDFFCRISELDKSFARWYELGSSRKDALRRRARIDDLSYWKGRLDQGRHRTDVNQRVMRKLGFSVAVWNGGPDDATSKIRVHCGVYSETITNVVTMNCHSVDRAEVFAEALRITADIWQPDWAGVTSDAAMGHRNYNAALPFVDWMTYVCDEWLPEPPELKAPSTVERLPGGTLIVVQETPPDVDDQAHQRNIQRVQKALKSRLTVGTA